MLLQMKFFDLSLKIFKMLSKFVEGLEEGLTPLVDDVDPAVEVGEQPLQVLKLGQTLFVFSNKPFRS